MNNLIKNSNRTIKSTELVDIINEFRKKEGNKTELRHDSFMEKIKKEIETLKSLNINSLQNFSESTYINSRGKQYSCFELNRDGMLQMLNSESAYVRYKTIEYINNLEDKLKKQLFDSYMIEDPIKRAEAWIKEQKERQNLMLSNKQKDQIIWKQKPKTIFADAVSTSKTSILVGELAKILRQNGYDIGQNRLFAWLRNNGYLISRKGTDYNMPTQRSMELELFEIKETSIAHSDGHTSTEKTPKVTGKGQIYFINKFKQQYVT